MKKLKKEKRTLFEILTYPSDVLRAENELVANYSTYLNLALNMIHTMKVVRGIGIAAPQISKNIRMAVAMIDKKPLTFFNPEIIDGSPGGESFKEGCLSFPGLLVDVGRPKWIDVKYYDIKGRKHFKRFEGINCVIMCHEIDHLNGKLIIDYKE